MSELSEIYKKRTLAFAVNTLRLIDRLPRTTSGYVVARQLAKSATSIGANYRASCIARSRDEFIAKLGVVVEEADEAIYWFELITAANLLRATEVRALLIEGAELRAIFGKSLGTARLNRHVNNQITR